MDLLTALRGGLTLAAFMESSRLREAMIEAGVATSTGSYAQIALARDKRARAWSAIIHCEDTHGRLEKEFLRNHLRWAFYDHMKLELIAAQYDYVGELLANCYFYLNEPEHDAILKRTNDVLALENRWDHFAAAAPLVPDLSVSRYNPRLIWAVFVGDAKVKAKRFRSLSYALSEMRQKGGDPAPSCSLDGQ